MESTYHDNGVKRLPEESSAESTPKVVLSSEMLSACIERDLFQRLLVLEPNPIDTGRMRVVDKIDSRKSHPRDNSLMVFSNCFENSFRVLADNIPNSDGPHRTKQEQLDTTTRSSIQRNDRCGEGFLILEQMKKTPANNTHNNKKRRTQNVETTVLSVVPMMEPIILDTSDPYNIDRWNEKFDELVAFIQSHGHSRIPVRFNQNPPLSQWAKRQRYQWKLKYEGKHSTLSDSRETQLSMVGFLWDIRTTVWEEKYAALQQFQRRNGHLNVPIACQEYPKLGTWVKSQRRQWKLLSIGQRSCMTIARARKLDAIGFCWETSIHNK